MGIEYRRYKGDHWHRFGYNWSNDRIEREINDVTNHVIDSYTGDKQVVLGDICINELRVDGKLYDEDIYFSGAYGEIYRLGTEAGISLDIIQGQERGQ